jgi:hypothetical protein
LLQENQERMIVMVIFQCTEESSTPHISFVFGGGFAGLAEKSGFEG